MKIVKLFFFSFLLFFYHSSMGQKPQIKTPGVYVQEVPTGIPSVAQVETAIPAFLGYTEKATLRKEDDLRFIPKRISSLREFETLYGGQAALLPFILHQSLGLYFRNGGGSCYIVSIGNYNNSIQKEDFNKGLVAIEKEDEPTLLLFPDAVNLPGNDLYDVQNAALKQAATLLDRFCILDLKFADNQTKHNIAVKEFRRYIGPDNLKYGAAYTPHLKTAGSNPVILPASAAVAGQYCSVDASRGVWKAPANVGLAYVGQLLYTITNNEQDGLNIDVNAGKSINAIRPFAGRGFLIWGARTLDGNDNEWRYVPVRRFFMVVEESIKKACLPFVFERNDANTWSKVKSLIENYLTLIWRDGAMAGSSPREAFFVKVGLGETMTAGDVQQGNMIFEIGMAAVRPAEFIIIRISQKMAQ